MNTLKHQAFAVAAFFMAGCAARSILEATPPNHPASPQAPEAVVPEPAAMLGGASTSSSPQEIVPQPYRGHGVMHGGGHTMPPGSGEMGADETDEPTSSRGDEQREPSDEK